jgi:hypothetical protein
MPYAINGFGTRLYGKRDFWSDGSYLTTCFVSALWIPLIPINSLRIRETGGFNVVIFSNLRYMVFEKRRPHMPQVLSVWAYVAALIAAFYFGMGQANSDILVLAWTPFALLCALPQVLRYLAKKRIPQSSAAGNS